ncbi:hypothetical protein LGQ04_07850 [Cellulosimicrobium marinum]|nr:hypothetical protein [Cellulosimicrobium marinum]
MSGGPRVRRLPVRTVLVELPGAPDAVETDPTALPAPPRRAAWRRWGWAVAFVPTLAAIVYQRTAPGQGWPVPSWVVAATTVGLLATALLALVRYQDDRAAAADTRGQRALLDAPARATGTFTPTGSASPTDQDDAARSPLSGLVTLTTAAGETLARPLRVVVPDGAAGPRAGDPLAVWHAATDPDATGVLLVRYDRGWADDLLSRVARD